MNQFAGQDSYRRRHVDETTHPDRVIKINNAQNVRDLGGYTTNDGRQTRWGSLVRSGDMDQLTKADQDFLIDYGINTVIDLRMKWEIADAPNVFSRSQRVNFVMHDFWGDRFDDYRSKRKKVAPEVKLSDLYRSGLIESGFIMADIMRTIADSLNNGFAFQCRSGKDRTGMVAAILLAVAGVPNDVICADYALTASLVETDKNVDPKQPGMYLKGCSPQTMALTLEFLAGRFSSIPGYLLHLGVTEAQIDRIRDKILD